MKRPEHFDLDLAEMNIQNGPALSLVGQIGAIFVQFSIRFGFKRPIQ
jgi:hypothetical protein